MTNVIFKLVSSCLWCEKEISMKRARAGKMLCSVDCMKKINKKGGSYDLDDVVGKRMPRPKGCTCLYYCSAFPHEYTCNLNINQVRSRRD